MCKYNVSTLPKDLKRDHYFNKYAVSKEKQHKPGKALASYEPSFESIVTSHYQSNEVKTPSPTLAGRPRFGLSRTFSSLGGLSYPAFEPMSSAYRGRRYSF